MKINSVSNFIDRSVVPHVKRATHKVVLFLYKGLDYLKVLWYNISLMPRKMPTPFTLNSITPDNCSSGLCPKELIVTGTGFKSSMISSFGTLSQVTSTRCILNVTFLVAGTYSIYFTQRNGTRSNTVSVTVGGVVLPIPPTTPIPDVPTGLSITAGDGVVASVWNASANALRYLIKRGTVSGGPYSTLATVTTTSYTDRSVVNGTVYYYVVAAQNDTGTSANSSQRIAQPAAPVPVPAPNGLVATGGNAEVDLAWNAAPGAISYTLYRGTASGGPYGTTLTTQAGTTYNDATVSNGTTYYYVVTVTTASGTSANSVQASVTPNSPPPDPPDLPDPPPSGPPGSFTGATYNVTSTGWLRCAHAFPIGAVPSGQGVVFTGVDTQNTVLKAWPDGSAKHILLTAHFGSTGNKSLVLGTPVTGTFVATAPTLVLEATPEGGTVKYATFTDTDYTDLWDNGPLCKETRQMVSFTGATGALQYARVIFYLASYNDGTHTVNFTIDNSINQAGAGAIPASLNYKIGGVSVATKTCTVTPGPGTITSNGGGFGLTTSQAHGLSKGDYVRYTWSGLPAYSKVWETAGYGSTGFMSYNSLGVLGDLTWEKLTFIIPWGVRGPQRFLVGGHTKARYEPDLTTFYTGRFTHKPHPSLDHGYSTTMQISTPNVGGKQYDSGDFDLFNYGIYAPQISLGGQRPELTLKPEWVMQWELDKTDALYDFMISHADLAGLTSFHMSNADGSMFRLSQNPAIHLTFGGYQIENVSRFMVCSPEINGANGHAHQGGYFFAPYLFTGDRYYAEEMAYHTMYGVVNSDAYLSARGGGNGWLFGAGNGLRSGAWVACKLAECVAFLPSSKFSTEVAEFQTYVNNNNTREAFYLALEPDTGLNSAIMSHERLLVGNTTTVVNPPLTEILSSPGHTNSMFMQAYVVMAADHADRLGVPIFAGYKTRICQFWLNYANNISEPRHALGSYQYLSMPYQTTGTPITKFSTYQQMMDFNVTNGWLNASSPEKVTGNYAIFLRFMLAVASKAGMSGALSRLNWLEAIDDPLGDFTYPFVGTNGFSYGLSNAAYALDASEGYRP